MVFYFSDETVLETLNCRVKVISIKCEPRSQTKDFSAQQGLRLEGGKQVLGGFYDVWGIKLLQ